MGDQSQHHSDATSRRLTNIIDVHSHTTLEIGPPVPQQPTPDWSVEKALALMDANNVAAAVLSMPDVANKTKDAKARDTARRMNEQLATIVQKHPTRFTALATVPGQDIDGTLAEMTYALDTLKMDGVATTTSINDCYLGDTRYNPWFEEMNRRGTTLFVHPAIAQASLTLGLGLHPAALEFMFDTTRMLANMVTTGAKSRFSAINIICTHAGGTLPYLFPRLQTMVRANILAKDDAHVPLTPEQLKESLASFYYDLTAGTSPAQLYALGQLVPTSRLLMGFDVPFMPAETLASARADVENWADFTAADLSLIAHENARPLFPGLAQRLV